jgi:probable phosphoglycerate mutase
MIYLVRHGRTAFNAEGRYQGHCDSPLLPHGLAQARRYGELLARLIDDPAAWTLVSSPLGRAVATAEIIADALGLPADFPRDPRLMEIGMGRWERLTDFEIDQEFPGARDGASRYDFFFRAPGGEGYDGVAARMRDWLDEAAAEPRPRIVVSHGVAGRVLRGLYLGLDPAAALTLEAPQDAIFRMADGEVTCIACEPIAA